MENSSWLLDHTLVLLPNPQTVTIIFHHNLSSLDPPSNPAAPDAKFTLEYVYGYRCADSRQNVFFNSAGQAVYMTAALGIILDQSSNTQKFFGGGQVANTAKNVANDE